MANEAPVFSYQGPTDIERVFTDHDAKVFHVTSTLIRLPSDKGVNITSANPIRVFSEDGEVIGFANVYGVEGALVCDAHLNYNHPARLDLETGGTYYIAPLVVTDEDQVHVLDALLTRTPVPGNDPVQVRS